MESYTHKTGLAPDFRVSYTMYSPEQGGRTTPAHQHIRWDFQYADTTVATSNFCIWPEAVSTQGEILPPGPLPVQGLGDMFIVAATMRAFHQQHIRPGVRGYFVEGLRRVAVCEVVEILDMHINPVAES